LCGTRPGVGPPEAPTHAEPRATQSDLAPPGGQRAPRPILLGATLGFLALRDAPEIITLSVLALTGGALTAVVVEEMVGEAHEDVDPTLGPVFLTAGFAIFGLISAYFGQ
jgi:hypothetical protein